MKGKSKSGVRLRGVRRMEDNVLKSSLCPWPTAVVWPHCTGVSSSSKTLSPVRLYRCAYNSSLHWKKEQHVHVNFKKKRVILDAKEAPTRQVILDPKDAITRPATGVGPLKTGKVNLCLLYILSLECSVCSFCCVCAVTGTHLYFSTFEASSCARTLMWSSPGDSNSPRPGIGGECLAYMSLAFLFLFHDSLIGKFIHELGMFTWHNMIMKAVSPADA